MTTPQNSTTPSCPGCGGLGHTPMPIHYVGLGNSPVTYCRDCPEGRGRLRAWAREPEQRAYTRRLKTAKVKRALEVSCMGAEFEGVGLVDLVDQPRLWDHCTHYVQQWSRMLEHGQGFYFWGIIGSGKTHAAAVLANELIERHLVETLFLNVPEAAQRFRQAIGDHGNGDGMTLFARMKDVELLVLDDLGLEQPSAWVSDLIYQVVDERWREHRPMVVTSDLSPAQLGRRYRPQIASRIMGCCKIVRVCGEDRRRRKLPRPR